MLMIIRAEAQSRPLVIRVTGSAISSACLRLRLTRRTADHGTSSSEMILMEMRSTMFRVTLRRLRS